MGGFFGTNVGHFQPLGIEGWRLAFHLVAVISLTTAGLVYFYGSDPRRKVRTCSSPSTCRCFVGCIRLQLLGTFQPGSEYDLLSCSLVGLRAS